MTTSPTQLGRRIAIRRHIETATPFTVSLRSGRRTEYVRNITT
jgi:hypothetical protein